LKQYGNHVILSVERQEFPKGIYWIKGVNGSGKTTFLKSIGGIIPFSGKIEINGFDSKVHSIDYRKQVSFSEAEPFFPSYLSAGELIEYFKFTRKADKSEVENLCLQLGINSFLDQQCGGYSAGMHKKLSICLALIGSPEWILLDEPFAFIDDHTERQLITIIDELVQKGKGFILTSHHMIPFQGLAVRKKFIIEDKCLKDEY
jgi:ABC-2 type transport system ATP-binding protein